MSYRVKTVAAMTGIPRPTLLAWERRYDLLEPRRSPTGHRIYTDEDVALLRELKAHVDAGLSIGEAVRLHHEGAPAPVARAESPPDALARRLLDALLAFDRAAADELAPRPGQLPFREVVDEVYLPMLRETGDGWAEGRVSVAQEHFVSGWCREQLFAIFHGIGGGPVGGRVAVCALAPGEVHELGLLAVAVHLALAGWRVVWLGADLPADELRAWVAERRPRLVCLSVMMDHAPGEARGWAVDLLSAAPGDTLVAVGGRAVPADLPEGVLLAGDGAALVTAVRARGR